MPPEAQKIAELLRAIAAAVENLSAAEANELIRELGSRSGTGWLPERSGPKKFQNGLEAREIAELINELQRSKTRDEAATVLRRRKLTRRDLMELARLRSIHVTKDDNVSRIEEKLVEAVVGSRLNSEAIRGTRDFVEINSRIISETDSRIRTDIIHHRFRFVFNPESRMSKYVTFKADGTIGEGRNDNEYRWQVKSGRLEILDRRGETYSRFVMLPDGTLRHTNDVDTRSIKGQYLEPTRTD